MRTRTLRYVAVVALVVVLVISLAIAGAANTKKGKVYFKNNCRVCHDGKTPKAATLTPMTKTQAMWQKAFAPGGAAHGCAARVKEKTGTALTEQDLADIAAYLVQHAADSDQPATCGS